MAYTGFNKLKGQLGNRPGVTNPAALAASIGRQKYGAGKFNAAAAQGKSLNPAQNKTVQAVVAGRKKRKKRNIKLPTY